MKFIKDLIEYFNASTQNKILCIAIAALALIIIILLIAAIVHGVKKSKRKKEEALLAAQTSEKTDAEAAQIPAETADDAAPAAETPAEQAQEEAPAPIAQTPAEEKAPAAEAAEEEALSFSPELVQRIRKAVEALPEKTRLVVREVVVASKSYKETALQLDVSVNTVKTLLSRGLKELRRQFPDPVLFFALFKGA